MIPPMRRRLGRRGEFLLLFGGIYTLYGAGLIAAGPTETSRAGLALVTGGWVTFAVWGAVWVAAGLNAAVHAFRRGPGHDALGFQGLMVMPSVWAASYVWSWIIWVATAGEGGYGHGVLAAGIWAAAAVAVGIVAGWPEPSGHVPPSTRRPER